MITPQVMQILILLVIAGVCGSVAQRLAGGKRAGCLASIALGFIGALLGQWIAVKAKLPVVFPLRIGNQVFPVIWSIIGASIFAAVLAFLSGSNRKSKD